MAKIVIKDITLIYEEEQDKQIANIKKIINNNYLLILRNLMPKLTISLVPTENPQEVYISDFDNYVDNLIKNEYFGKIDIENNDLLNVLYIEYLVQTTPNSLDIPSKYGSVDDIFIKLAYIFYARQNLLNDFILYVKYRYNPSKIINWLKEETRFDIYNELLESILVFLNENEPYFMNHLQEITNQMALYVDKNSHNFFEPSMLVPQMTFFECESLFYEFLNAIKAPEEWFNIYENMKERKSLVLKLEKNDDDSSCYKDEKGNIWVSISYNKTLRNFFSLVHEFAHYLNLINSRNNPAFPTSEISSIFFERLAGEYLIRKGYPQELINNILNFRIINNLQIFFESKDLLIDLLDYLNYGKILRSKKVKQYNEERKIFLRSKLQLLKYLKDNKKDITQVIHLDSSLDIDETIDYIIANYFKDGFNIINGFQYLIGSIITDELLKKMANDESIIPMMFNVTNNLTNLSLEDILNYFGINDLFTRNESKQR